MYMYMYIYLSLYIYIYREREREREMVTYGEVWRMRGEGWCWMLELLEREREGVGCWSDLTVSLSHLLLHVGAT